MPNHSAAILFIGGRVVTNCPKHNGIKRLRHTLLGFNASRIGGVNRGEQRSSKFRHAIEGTKCSVENVEYAISWRHSTRWMLIELVVEQLGPIDHGGSQNCWALVNGEVSTSAMAEA